MQKLIKGRLSAPEVFLIVTLLVLGIIVCFMLPIGGGYDEETHLARIWEMSAFVFVPNQGLGREMPLPTIFERFHTGERYWFERLSRNSFRNMQRCQLTVLISPTAT